MEINEKLPSPPVVQSQVRPNFVHRFLLIVITSAIWFWTVVVCWCERAAAQAKLIVAQYIYAFLDVLLRRRSIHLSRIPDHIAVVVSHVPKSTAIDWDRLLADWTTWCIVYGVRRFSLFDAADRGLCEEKRKLALAASLKQKLAEKLCGKGGTHSPVICLTINDEKSIIPAGIESADKLSAVDCLSIHVDLWCSRFHGRSAIVQLTRQLAEENVSPSDVSREFIDNELARRFGLSEPNLLVQVDPVLGGCTLPDCLPWHLRLSELHHLPDARLDGLAEHQFVACLEAFASRNQRFGR